MCVYEGFVIKLQKKAGSTELSTKKKKRDFLHQKEIDWSKKLQKNKEKKQEIFIRRDRRAFDWEKKQLCLLSNSSSFLIFSVTNL